MTERDETVIFSLNGDDGLPEQLETFDDFTPAEDRPPSGTANGLVSLGYLMGAIKRAARFWLALGIVGLLIGAAYDVKSPPAEKASTSVLITYGPDENPSSAVLDNQAIAESRSVAELAMRKLGLQESVGSFQKATTATIVTDRVLQITVSAPTSAEAVSRANAVAAAFLQFRASQMEAAQNLLVNSLEQQVAQAQADCGVDQLADQPGVGPAVLHRAGQPAQESAGPAQPGDPAVGHRSANRSGHPGEHRHRDGRDGQRGARPGRRARALAHQVPGHLRRYRARHGPGPGPGHRRDPGDRVRPAASARRRVAGTRRAGEAQRRRRAAEPLAAGSAWAGRRPQRRGPADRRAPARHRAAPAPGAPPPWPLFPSTTRRSRRWPWCQWRCPGAGRAQRRAGGPGQRHARCLARGQRGPRSQVGDRARCAADPRGARP